jgi:hypothetical protein
MVLSVFWFILVVVLGAESYRRFRSRNAESFLRDLRGAILNRSSSTDFIYCLFLIAWILLPLGLGMPVFLRTDANVLVVLIFLVWSYQSFKLVWNSFPGDIDPNSEPGLESGRQAGESKI